MKVSTKKFAIAFYESLQEPHGKSIDEILRNFVHILAKRRVLGRVETIISDFIEYYNAQEGIACLRVTSADNLHEDQENAIIKLYEETLGKKIELQKTIDKNILGGIIIGYNDVIIDGSIKKQLDCLQEQLIQ